MKQVYFLRRADGTGPIKIGCSEALETRRKQISINYRAEMVIVAAAPGDFLTERNLQFATHRVAVEDKRKRRNSPLAGASEWFAAAPALLALIEKVNATGEIPLSKADCRERIFAERYLAGETLQQIGDDYGITRERVRQVLRRIGVESLGLRPEHRRKAHDLTADEIAAALAYQAGELPAKICDTFGLQRQQLIAACRRLGVAIRPKGAPFKFGDPKFVAARVAALYHRGVPIKEIKNEFGFSHIPNVYRWLQRAGVKPGRRPTCGNFGSRKAAA